MQPQVNRPARWREAAHTYAAEAVCSAAEKSARPSRRPIITLPSVLAVAGALGALVAWKGGRR